MNRLSGLPEEGLVTGTSHIRISDPQSQRKGLPEASDQKATKLATLHALGQTAQVLKRATVR